MSFDHRFVTIVDPNPNRVGYVNIEEIVAIEPDRLTLKSGKAIAISNAGEVLDKMRAYYNIDTTNLDSSSK